MNMEISDQLREIIGEDGMFESGIFIFTFITREGKGRTAYLTIEEPNVTQSLGMLSLVQHAVAEQGMIDDDDS